MVLDPILNQINIFKHFKKYILGINKRKLRNRILFKKVRKRS